MRLVTTREASQLTGLSKDKLREWTSRRALIPADVRPKNQGSPARYSWQTILLLRIAVVLKDGFHLELHAHRRVFTSLRRGFHGTSFIRLWGKALVIHANQDWGLADEGELALSSNDAILIRLTPHLEILSEGFALPMPSSSPGQLDLFPVQSVVEERRTAVHPLVQPHIEAASSGNRRRRSM
jgi:hypothetical protein